jgi:purine-cytosine permease-like protein
VSGHHPEKAHSPRAPSGSYWLVATFLLLWGLAYAWLVLNTFVLASAEDIRSLVENGVILPEYADYIQRLPSWVIAITAVTAVTRLGGAFALLLRHRWAVPLYAISMACVCVIFLRGFVFANVTSVIRPSQIAVEALFFSLSVFALWFSVHAKRSPARTGMR